MAEPLRRTPSYVSDPWWGTPRCRMCGGRFYADQTMKRKRPWPLFTRAFVHIEGECLPESGRSD